MRSALAGLVFLLSIPPGIFGLTWKADLGFSGLIPTGTWVPLRVTVEGSASPWTLEAITVPLDNTARWTEAGPGVFEYPVFVPEGVSSLHLILRADGGQVDAVDLAVAGQSFPGHLILVWGQDGGVRRGLESLLLPWEPLRVANVNPAAWPTSPLSLEGVSALVVQDPGPVLSPAQAVAVKAWVASGGRLVVDRPRASSLMGQLGESAGLGRLVSATVSDTPSFLKAALALRPWGEVRKLGEDFEPASPVSTPGREAPLDLGFVLVWSLAGGLLAFGRRLKLTMAIACLGTLTAAVLWGSGQLSSNNELSMHGREVVLPGGAGRFTSLEVALGTAKIDPFQWPATSPWALEAWKAAHSEFEASARISEPQRLVLESFAPPVARTSEFWVRWSGESLMWSARKGSGSTALEQTPAEFRPDAAWLARVAAIDPKRSWSVGLEGGVCWISPGVPR